MRKRSRAVSIRIRAAEALNFIRDPEMSSQENQASGMSDAGDAQNGGSRCLGRLEVVQERSTGPYWAGDDPRVRSDGPGQDPSPAIALKRSRDFRGRGFNGDV